ncbi:ATP-grasp fold amidoligase family protein [Alkalihalobacterium alkalinitrilicum]|uniref:ATP-grasp fold amidoligase family protein n=1 Tax=Alkalihalobacterium alkalinitrilicum TaxID=427920 RepID=UPI000994B04F|nr:ATP-grasp fold amidoligase family protein [Alkalihalobacterium alkalinitrilicum]
MKITENLTKVINNPYKILSYFGERGMLKTLPDNLYLKLLFRARLGKELNLRNPNTFNEKLQWLKIYDRNPKYTTLVDKYEVRKHVSNTIGKEYLIPLLGVYDKVDEIDITTLPNEFVLKCTHDSGGIVICKNKNNFDVELAREKLRRSINKNYFYQYREWPYKNVNPKIVCEKYMVDESGKELKDYKIFCFNGEPKIIQVDFNRFTGHTRNLYDTNWNYLPTSFQYPTNPDIVINKPNRLAEMIKLARILAEGLTFVRIDFYSINDRIFFGEITFYPESGFGNFYPNTLGVEMGEWIKLSKIN